MRGRRCGKRRQAGKEGTRQREQEVEGDRARSKSEGGWGLRGRMVGGEEREDSRRGERGKGAVWEGLKEKGEGGRDGCRKEERKRKEGSRGLDREGMEGGWKSLTGDIEVKLQKGKKERERWTVKGNKMKYKRKQRIKKG